MYLPWKTQSGESGSWGGLGSDTSIFTSMDVRPLSRCGERGIFAPAIRNAADGAASRTAASSGRCARHRRKHVIQVMPLIRLQPSPTGRDVILWNKDLEESLSPSFAADESAVGFGEGSGRQNQLGFFGGRIGEVIEDDHVCRY